MAASEGTCCRALVSSVSAPFRVLWEQWWFITLCWYACAIFTHYALKRASEKGMVTAITMFSNLVLGWPLVAPFAIWQGLGPVRTHWRPVLAISVLAGLEKNLTNSSLYSIGVSLKTALHTFNVIFTLFLAAFLGVDPKTRFCIFGCQCRGNLRLTLSIVLVLSGGLATAAFEPGKDDWAVNVTGVALQLASSLCYALKFVTIKMLLGDESRQEMFLLSQDKPPSSVQIAFLANPVIGLISFAFFPLVEKTIEVPYGLWGTAAQVAVSITGILLLQLRLTQLTSPLTVAILGVLKDVLTVLFFTSFTEEDFTMEQAIGYSVSALGVVFYACSLRGRPALMREDSSSTVGSAVEHGSYASSEQGSRCPTPGPYRSG